MRSQLPWMASVKVGDVLENANGTQRVVRKVTRYKDGGLRSCYFTILHCSWTGRPYTVLHYSDLKTYGYRPVGVNLRKRTKLDKQLVRQIDDHFLRGLTCCDVHGIV